MTEIMSLIDKPVLVLGAGNFGTCLAQQLATKGQEVYLTSRHHEVVKSINEQHRNSRYLHDFPIHENVIAIQEDLEDFDLMRIGAVVVALPTQAIRPVLEALKSKLHPDLLWISAAKGIENSTLSFPSQIFTEVLGELLRFRPACLSGPSFASEVMVGQPTAVTVASEDEAVAVAVQKLFHCSTFRAYTTVDMVGLELSGALKNVIAIASGACEGLGFQENSKAALITRGLAEMTRIGVAMGADPLTFKGLGGIGDLLLTCSSKKSRNFTVGYRLGKREMIQDVLTTLGSVAEGYYTSEAAFKLAKAYGADSPIVNQVYAVLYEEKEIYEAVLDLLNREPKPETH